MCGMSVFIVHACLYYIQTYVHTYTPYIIYLNCTKICSMDQGIANAMKVN
jgi:hypothetical protein